jgi:hypothetical protein
LPLIDGCYLIKYTPTLPESVSYDGTIRVETKTGRTIASGDLYEHEIFLNADLEPVEFVANPAAGIPVFPIRSYRFYFRITDIRAADAGFNLTFEVFRFSAPPVTFFDGGGSSWLSEGAFTATLASAPADAGFPLPEQFFAGAVADETGTTIGEMTMGWVSASLRRAVIEIDCVAGCAPPLNNGEGVDWKAIFDDVGWDVTAFTSDSDVVEPKDGVWDRAEAHAAMEERREKIDLNVEWRYHALAVRKIKKVSPESVPPGFDRDNGESGHMYDDVSFGENTTPREGFMVAADWQVPDKPKWGLVRGKRGQDTVNYFRAAAHELGHAMGLRHNNADNGLMNTSEEIADTGTDQNPFPSNIIWRFSALDEHRLRHWPDLVVRPGGTAPNSGDRAPSTTFVSDRHRLEVAPLLAAVPLGAPVRVHVKLSNVTGKPVDSPASLSLSSGFVSGRVIDPAGKARTFSSLVVNENQHATKDLPAGGSLEDWLTLLQGAQGALFPMPGTYRVVVEVAWRGKTEDVRNKLDFTIAGETAVTVTPAEDAAHANAARRLLATSETLPVLALGGDHLAEGMTAIGAALDNKVLRPHFAYIEAKRRATRFFKRDPDVKGAAELIDDTTVMSPAEYRKAAQLVRNDPKRAGAQDLARKLKAKIARQPLGGEVEALVRAL